MELGHVITEKEKKGRPKRAIAGSEKFVAGFLSGLMWTSPDLMWISSAMSSLSLYSTDCWLLSLLDCKCEFSQAVMPRLDDLNVANFFFGKGLASWLNMKLQFTKITNGANFLPREVADSIPFSSTKLPQILNRFSLRPKSVEAQIMKETNEQCEGPGNVGEDKYCATSLESLIDFSTLELGKKCSSTFN
ncbi:hypothetical protein L1049_019133 [Liquidambar formosana]|uniref:BURP domain-containing protein n=1 Tax=Liquidambar formosana TaxID=63359 RepID=A0AAP0RB26_LIQFO